MLPMSLSLPQLQLFPFHRDSNKAVVSSLLGLVIMQASFGIPLVINYTRCRDRTYLYLLAGIPILMHSTMHLISDDDDTYRDLV